MKINDDILSAFLPYDIAKTLQHCLNYSLNISLYLAYTKLMCNLTAFSASLPYMAEMTNGRIFLEYKKNNFRRKFKK